MSKFLSVKTLVGFEIFVDFVRLVEQFFVGLLSLRSSLHRKKIFRQNEQNQQKFQSRVFTDKNLLVLTSLLYTIF
jgi:hypothetical protein